MVPAWIPSMDGMDPGIEIGAIPHSLLFRRKREKSEVIFVQYRTLIQEFKNDFRDMPSSEGTGTRPVYLVNLAHHTIEGPHGKKMHRNREIVVD